MSTIGDDLIERSVDIHWPDGYDPGHADLFAHNTIIIDAPAETIWAKLVAATAWPAWYSNASDVVVDDPSGTLSDGVTFNWTTFGLKIASTIAEYVPHARIGWYGTGDQLHAYHTWLLIPRTTSSTYVVMEETGLGQSRPHAPRSRPVEHQPQVRVRELTRHGSAYQAS
jgi:Polyketide cyclase / dehydrase and lipid transport